MAEIVQRRRAERDRLISVARDYVARLSSRIPVRAAAVVGSVARGDFNVWSDIDVIVVSDALPERIPDRAAVLADVGSGGVEPVGFTTSGFRAALAKGNRLARSVRDEGVILLGRSFFHDE
jgi:hypothetical protein